MSDSQYDISPGDIATPGVDGGPSFTLVRPEWLAIQTFVNDGRFLPGDDATFRAQIGPGAPSDLSDFEPLITAYAAINQHCTTWYDTAFPNTVALADAVYDYGAHKAPIYYPAILKEAQILSDDSTNQSAAAALKAMLGVLEGVANDYAGKAAAAATEIGQFADATQSDHATLVGTDEQGGLLKQYNDEYGAKSADAKNLADQITAQRQILDAANAEYNHDVVVAATSPSYAWVFPVGTIAAAVVAGVYGHKAVEALDRAHAAQQQLYQLAAEQAAAGEVLKMLGWSVNSIGGVRDALDAALPVVQKIQGVWGALAADLGGISNLIDSEIAQVPPVIMDLGVEDAVKTWHSVALAADAYRVNAYVTPSGGPDTSMEASKVALQMSSDRVATPVAA